MPKTPDEMMLDAAFEDFAASAFPGEAADDVFEKFAITQFIKPRELSIDELDAGIVDDAKDGGLDSCFVFVNGALLEADDALLEPGSNQARALPLNPVVEVVLVQSKNSGAWKESVWEKLLSTLPNVLDISKRDAALEQLYNTEVVERTGIFRRVSLALASKFPRIKVRIAYVCRAPEANITDTVTARAEQVRAAVSSVVTHDADVRVEHVGIHTLYKLAGTTYSDPATLVFQDLIREADSFIGVVYLRDYLAFVRDGSGALREELFESNVRDYEGDNTVNQAIGETLAESGVEFWWMNNGVTVLSDQVDSPQLTLTVSRPLVVNGLQTSHVLHTAEQTGAIDPSRLTNRIVVRVIVSTDEDVRDRIIAGTNRQTQVPTPALYATRPFQMRIENYFKVHNLYYERRKNRYKNKGIPAKQRVTMNLLAQVMIAANLGRPDDARARPSTLLGRPGGYDAIFPETLDLEAYLRAVEILRGVDDYLRTTAAKAILDDFTNARFYIVTGYVLLRLRARRVSDIHFEKNFSRVKPPLSKSTLTEALTLLSKTAKSFRRRHPGVSQDAMFKNSDFRDAYIGALVETLPLSKRTAATKTTDVHVATPTKQVPTKQTPAKKTPAKKTPAKKTPAKKTPAKKTPAKKMT